MLIMPLAYYSFTVITDTANSFVSILSPYTICFAIHFVIILTTFCDSKYEFGYIKEVESNKVVYNIFHSTPFVWLGLYCWLLVCYY